MTHNSLIGRAIRAYGRRFGPWADCPSGSTSTVSARNVVTLRNGNGILARYRYNPARNRLAWVVPAAR
jgi:YD repeat-containing protein